jgi:hypothetical protein
MAGRSGTIAAEHAKIAAAVDNAARMMRRLSKMPPSALRIDRSRIAAPPIHPR